MPAHHSRWAILAILFLSLSACSSLDSVRHEYVMRGQVVEVSGSNAVICVGSADGAAVGQTLKAYRLVSVNVSGGPARNPPRWIKEQTGIVRIVEILDQHFARAQVSSGTVDTHNVVELVR